MVFMHSKLRLCSIALTVAATPQNLFCIHAVSCLCQQLLSSCSTVLSEQAPVYTAMQVSHMSGELDATRKHRLKLTNGTFKAYCTYVHTHTVYLQYCKYIQSCPVPYIRDHASNVSC